MLARKRCEELDNNVQMFSNKLSENDVSATQQVTAWTAKLMDKEETLAQLQAEVREFKGGFETCFVSLYLTCFLFDMSSVRVG